MFLQDPTIKGFEVPEKKQNIVETKDILNVPSKTSKTSSGTTSSSILPFLAIAVIGGVIILK